MKEQQILFNLPMVRALLTDTKTQTRRVVNFVKGIGAVTEFQPSDTPNYDWIMRDRRMLWNDLTNANLVARCPYGQPGTRLRVKESAWMWCERRPNGKTKTGRDKWHFVPMQEAPIHYAADHPGKPQVDVVSPDTGNRWGWRLKIGRFLPAWASRSEIEVVSVRVERLQDISEEDAKAEGIYLHADGKYTDYLSKTGFASNPIASYASLWESINGPGSWGENPWVWVVTFKVVKL